MSVTISSINYCPVKSVSFQTIEKCQIKKNVGITGDRIFAFARGLDVNQAKSFEKNPEDRRGKWNKIVTLKNSPILNKYNFTYDGSYLTLTLKNEKIFKINSNILSEYQLLSNKEYNLTMIMVTHQMGFAREISDRVCFFNEGKIFEQGPPEQLFGSPQNERTKQFLRAVLDAN